MEILEKILEEVTQYTKDVYEAILTISLSIKEETKRINVHILYKELKKQQSLSVHTWMKLFLKWKKLKKRK